MAHDSWVFRDNAPNQPESKEFAAAGSPLPSRGAVGVHQSSTPTATFWRRSYV